MTLRLRMVAALTALVTVGLFAFGVVSYRLYARSQYDRLEEQARALVSVFSAQLGSEAGFGGRVPTRRGGPGRRPAVVVAAPGTYAELRSASGAVLARQQVSTTDTEPALPDGALRAGEAFTTGSVEGATRWRVVVSGLDRPGIGGAGVDATVVVAMPLTEVQESLNRLVLIEAGAGAVLLAVLAGGAWVILRRGLRPLESMAASARTISTGKLSERVAPADDRSEVGQLGLALNTMLADIEAAFAQRDATERRLRQFLADASHELRTPLTSIQGFAELFRVGGDEVDLAVVMRRIEGESARMKALVEDLLLLARLDQTRPATFTPVDLAVLAADACTDAVASAPERPVSLDAPAAVLVAGDSDHLRAAIANLMTNALRHTPAGTPVEVRVGRGEGRAVLSVRDHGPGLDETALRHAFDRFWRADRARVGPGAGLGLAIVAGIAAEHGGTVEAANAPGGGAVFRLCFPALDDSEAPRPSPSRPWPTSPSA